MARVKVSDMGPISPLGQGTANIGGSSNVRTSGPFTRGHMAQYGKPDPAARQYGTGSGDRSRDAFARAGAQQAGNAYMSQMGDANRDYQKRAEQLRSADIYSQRADRARRYGMDESYKADRRGIQLSRREDMRNIRNRLDEHRRNTDLEWRHNMLNLGVGGGTMSALGNAWNSTARGRSGSSVLGGLLGGMVGGPGGAVAGSAFGGGMGSMFGSLFG